MEVYTSPFKRTTGSRLVYPNLSSSPTSEEPLAAPYSVLTSTIKTFRHVDSSSPHKRQKNRKYGGSPYVRPRKSILEENLSDEDDERAHPYIDSSRRRSRSRSRSQSRSRSRSQSNAYTTHIGLKTKQLDDSINSILRDSSSRNARNSETQSKLSSDDSQTTVQQKAQSLQSPIKFSLLKAPSGRLPMLNSSSPVVASSRPGKENSLSLRLEPEKMHSFLQASTPAVRRTTSPLRNEIKPDRPSSDSNSEQFKARLSSAAQGGFPEAKVEQQKSGTARIVPVDEKSERKRWDKSRWRKLNRMLRECNYFSPENLTRLQQEQESMEKSISEDLANISQLRSKLADFIAFEGNSNPNTGLKSASTSKDGMLVLSLPPQQIIDEFIPRETTGGFNEKRRDAIIDLAKRVNYLCQLYQERHGKAEQAAKGGLKDVRK